MKWDTQNIKLIAIVWIFLMWISINRTAGDAVNSTACFSDSTNSKSDCITHKLQCNDTAVINILRAMYGYKKTCTSFTGISNCGSTKCCMDEKDDCFLSLSEEPLIQARKMCDGKSNCTLMGFKKLSECNGIVVNAYTLIEFSCEIKDQTPSTTFQSRTRNNPSPNRETKTTPSNFVTVEYQRTSVGIGSTETPMSSTHATSLRKTDILIISGSSVGLFLFILIVVIITCKLKRSSKNSTSNGKAVNSKTKAVANRRSIRQYDYISVDTIVKSPAKKITVYDQSREQDTNQKIGVDNSTIEKNQDDNYNHIPILFHRNFDEGEQAMGDNSSDDILFETYDHIGQRARKVRIHEDNYNHIHLK